MIDFSWFLRRPVAPFAAEYRRGTPRRYSRKTPVDGLKFVVIDCETTGFDPMKDRLLSLAALTVQGGIMSVSGVKSWLVYQPQPQMSEAVNIHGILPSETRLGEQEPVVLKQFLPLMTGAIIVGHHIHFDMYMLNAALERHFRVRLQNPTLDTAALAMQVLEAFRKTGYPGQRAPSLDEICVHCGITPLERHTAAGDAFTTAELLMVLSAKFARRLGRPLTVNDLPLERV